MDQIAVAQLNEQSVGRPDITANNLYADSLAIIERKQSKADSCTAPLPPAEPEQKFSGKEAYVGNQVMYSRMWNEINKSYYDKNALEDFKKLQGAFDDKLATPADLDLALKLMARSLDDRYTWYLSPSEVKKGAEEAANLKQSGLGLHKNADRFNIDSIAFGSSAHNTQLREGDTVRCINNVAIDTLSEKQTKSLLQGSDGKKVSVLAESKTDGSEYVTDLVLKNVPPPQVESELMDDVIYIRFPTFEERGRVSDYANLASFVDHFSKQMKDSDGKAKGIILDLRNNGGGDTEEAILFSSLFLQDGKTVVKLIPQNGMQERKVAPIEQLKFNGQQIDPETLTELRKIPLVVLSNGSSASSSELTIGALKDNNRATIIGEQTFGKGVGFKVVLGQFGGNMSITNLKYLTPSDYDLNGKGIAPDITVATDPLTKTDEQLDRALAQLRK